MRKALVAALLLLLAIPATAQVQVAARLEKDQFLAGEPVIVVFDIANVGTDVVTYDCCGAIDLDVSGKFRRVPPNIAGCFMGFGSGVGGASHSPTLAPGNRKSFRRVLREYDLEPGEYSLIASGHTGVRWYVPRWPPDANPQKPRRQWPDQVPGAYVEFTFSLKIARATPAQLEAAFAPLVADVDADDPERRAAARTAIADSAPPFLTSLIARIAADGSRDAIDALRRIGSAESRAHLKGLFDRGPAEDRAEIILALARVRHHDDLGFLAGVLANTGADRSTRGYAALGIGYIGGDEAVDHLQRALAYDPEIRRDVTIALGNTRSAAAVPVLIDLYGNNPLHNEVCGGLITLTHRRWCNATIADVAAVRRQWHRTWNDIASTAPIFGPDDCFGLSALPLDDTPEPARRQAFAGTRDPTITTIRPPAASPGAVVALSGYALGLEDSRDVKVILTRGDLVQPAKVLGGGYADSAKPEERLHYMDVQLPEEMELGTWLLEVQVHGRRSPAVALQIMAPQQVVITGMLTRRAHPSQFVELMTEQPGRAGDEIELTDASGHKWSLHGSPSSERILFVLPDEVADGPATIRVGVAAGEVNTFSEPFGFEVTSGPLPLSPESTRLMTAVAPGQWTDLALDAYGEFEVRRVDRVEVEFRQDRRTVISQARTPDNVHVQVPAALTAGGAEVRTRTWIENAASDWSDSETIEILGAAVAPSIDSIAFEPARATVWDAGEQAPQSIAATPQAVMILRGNFPVASGSDLRVQLVSQRETLDLDARDNDDGGVRVTIPERIPPGDWHLVVAGRTPPSPAREVTILRVK